MKPTRKICSVKGKGVVDPSTIKRCLKKFLLVSTNLDNQAGLDQPKIVDSEAVLQAIESSLMSSAWRVSGNLIYIVSSGNLIYILIYTNNSTPHHWK